MRNQWLIGTATALLMMGNAAAQVGGSLGGDVGGLGNGGSAGLGSVPGTAAPLEDTESGLGESMAGSSDLSPPEIPAGPLDNTDIGAPDPLGDDSAATDLLEDELGPGAAGVGEPGLGADGDTGIGRGVGVEREVGVDEEVGFE